MSTADIIRMLTLVGFASIAFFMPLVIGKRRAGMLPSEAIWVLFFIYAISAAGVQAIFAEHWADTLGVVYVWRWFAIGAGIVAIYKALRNPL